MSVDPSIIKHVQKKIAALLPENLTVVQTAAFYLEVISNAVNKGDGLRSICLHLGIDPSHAIAFGDSENDIPMLKAAGLGIAMQNADARVQAAADRVTLSNNENGIAKALKKIFEKNEARPVSR
jgi:Cof subfamily protein (haloacid dehalogenase superfamily)